MNVIGEGINPTISKQIQLRQKIQGSGVESNRTLEEIQYLNSKTAFIKLMSSVDIITDFNPTSPELKKILGSIGDNKLATEFVLFNGTSTINTTESGGAIKSSITQREGISRTNTILNNSAYGLGGLEFGLRPMPGIISMETKSENRGSLRTSTVRIKAWNRVQFEIIDILYLRLGYSVLLEFGNTIYFENEGTLIKNRPWSLQNGFLKGSYEVDSLQEAILDLRIKSDGNYDAIFGKIVNFSWDFNPDGSYDITLIIRSIGDVVESLKLNVLVNDTKPKNGENEEEDEEDEEPTITSFKDKNQLGSLFYETQKSAYLNNPNPRVGGGKVIPTNVFDNIPSIKDKKHFIIQHFRGTAGFYYIRLGSLLAYIEKFILPKYAKAGNSSPLLKFDYDQNTNLIYTVNNQVSMDPRVCLIRGVATVNGKDNYTYAEAGEFYRYDIANVRVGRVMDIYVNMLYILTTIDSNTGPENSSTLIDLLSTILTDISKSLGSINTLEPFIDEDTNTVKIIDQSTLPGKLEILERLRKSTSKDNAIINLYRYANGGASFVRNFGLKTEITPALSTIITVGAQAAGSVVGEDATAFSRLNLGLEDRIKNRIIDSDGGESTEENNALKDLNDRFPNANANFTKALIELGSLNDEYPSIDKDNIDSYSQLQSNFLSYVIAKESITTQKPSPTIGFIPVNLNLTIDGLSGLKIYNAISVDTSFLPSTYPDVMEFIITGISHKINNNIWTTSIDTNMIPRNPSSSPSLTLSNKTTPNNNSTTKSSSTPTNVAYFQSNLPENQAKQRVTLTRILDDGTQTLGILSVYSEDNKLLYNLTTVELPYKNNENGVSCVPTGVYLINSRQNSKYGKHFWLVGSQTGNWKRIPGTNPSDRTWVLIHTAPKAPGWLMGCIGPGPSFDFKVKNSKGNPNGIGSGYLEPSRAESKKALDKLVNTLFDAKGFKMEIKNLTPTLPTSINDSKLDITKSQYPELFGGLLHNPNQVSVKPI